MTKLLFVLAALAVMAESGCAEWSDTAPVACSGIANFSEEGATGAGGWKSLGAGSNVNGPNSTAFLAGPNC